MREKPILGLVLPKNNKEHYMSFLCISTNVSVSKLRSRGAAPVGSWHFLTVLPMALFMHLRARWRWRQSPSCRTFSLFSGGGWSIVLMRWPAQLGSYHRSVERQEPCLSRRYVGHCRMSLPSVIAADLQKCVLQTLCIQCHSPLSVDVAVLRRV